jgi:AcrR family transcriptional regulator
MPVLSRSHPTHAARKAETRGRILTATMNLLAEEGTSYAELAVERILESAGISRRTFYAHFADKRELLLELASSAVQPVLERIDESVSGLPSGPEAARETMTIAMQLARSAAPLYRAVVEAATYDDEIARFVHKTREQFIDALADRTDDQQRAGKALPIDARGAARILAYMFEKAAYEQVSCSTGMSDDQLVELLATAWVRTIYGNAWRSADWMWLGQRAKRGPRS